jgi:hypothetical protein
MERRFRKWQESCRLTAYVNEGSIRVVAKRFTANDLSSLKLVVVLFEGLRKVVRGKGQINLQKSNKRRDGLEKLEIGNRPARVRLGHIESSQYNQFHLNSAGDRV